jgi:hypothetical protein
MLASASSIHVDRVLSWRQHWRAGVPPFLAGDTFTQSNRNIQMVKVGINYLFNWSSYRY